MPARKIGTLLGAPELKALSRKARHLAELQQAYLSCVPRPLTRASRVADCRTGTLCVTADNGAIAAKLKQLAPSLLSNIQKREPEVTGIKIVVQVKDVTPGRFSAPTVNRARIENIGVFRELADRLPESDLKSAVSALVRRHDRARSENK